LKQKTRVPGLLYGVVFVIIGLAIFVEHRLVTDGRTDRRTDGHTMTAYTVLAQRRAVIKLCSRNPQSFFFRHLCRNCPNME